MNNTTLVDLETEVTWKQCYIDKTTLASTENITSSLNLSCSYISEVKCLDKNFKTSIAQIKVDYQTKKTIQYLSFLNMRSIFSNNTTIHTLNCWPPQRLLFGTPQN